jgi:hypothetical protein
MSSEPTQALDIPRENDVAAARGGSHDDGIDRRCATYPRERLSCDTRKRLAHGLHEERREDRLAYIRSTTPPFDNHRRGCCDRHPTLLCRAKQAEHPIAPPLEGNKRTGV